MTCWLGRVRRPEHITSIFAAVEDEVTVVLHGENRFGIFSKCFGIPDWSFVVSGIERVIEDYISVALHNKMDVREIMHRSMSVGSPNRFLTRCVHDEVTVLLNYRMILTVWTGKFLELLQHFGHVQLIFVLGLMLMLLR